jgi:protein-S-isoprenylcysteine O-methyltransferase Ste14
MKVIPKLLVATIVTVLVVGVALFLPAGTMAWPAAWVGLILFLGYVVAQGLWLVSRNPGLLAERMTGLRKPGRKAWDRALFGAFQTLLLAWLILMPLDAVRFGWSHIAVWLQGIGAVLLLGSFALLFVTFRENPYLSPAVRVQTERGQKVISTGPYRYVRHPMYAAIIPYFLGTALLLGSWYGALFGWVLAGMLAGRAVLEERVLRAELPGYAEYMAQVKYRFIPHVW